jgi:hypothetical protein
MRFLLKNLDVKLHQSGDKSVVIKLESVNPMDIMKLSKLSEYVELEVIFPDIEDTHE